MPSKNNLLQSTEKLQKVLANAGIASRREIERMISERRIKVDDHIATLGERITSKARVWIDNRLIQLKPSKTTLPRVLIYNKPEGGVCTRSDEKGRKTVFQHLPRISHARWIMIGRLDINSTGLLLFTDNGALANQLMHPSSKVKRVYATRIFGEVTEQMLQRLLSGVELEDGMAKFEDIQLAGGRGGINQWFHVSLYRGRNREVRRLWESQGVRVSRLVRISFANLTLPRTLRPARCQELTQKEVKDLIALVGFQT